MPYTPEQERQINQALLDSMRSPEHVKEAKEGLTDYIRTQMFENGFHDKVQPAQDLPEGSHLLVAEHDTLQFSYEIQPSAPSGAVIPFGQNPTLTTIRGRRAYAGMARIVSARARADVANLATYTMDIRQVYVDIMRADMDTVKDSNFIAAVNALLVSAGSTALGSTHVHWRTFESAITRNTLPEVKGVMASAPSSFEVEKHLMCNLTLLELEKIGFDELGGSAAEGIFFKGWTSEEVGGKSLISTIKRQLVPKGTIFSFGPTNALGPNYYRERATMYVEHKAWWVEFFIAMMCGAVIAHAGALSRVDFTGVA